MGLSCFGPVLFVMLLAGACSSPDNVAAPLQKDNTNEMVTPGPIRQTPERVTELTVKAKKGDIEAMFGLAAHHITASERVEARYWLGEAVRHGDCYAVELLIEESYFDVPAEELPHWRREQQRLGCDPNKTYFKKVGEPRREKPGK